VKDALARLQGVGDVQFQGGREYAMRIWLDPDKIAAHDLSASEVLAALRAQNLQVSAGVLNRPPVPVDQAYQINVEARGRLSTPEEFGDIVLKPDGQGRVTRVRDWRAVASQFDKVVVSPWIMVPDPQLAGVPWELGTQHIVRLATDDNSVRTELERSIFSRLSDVQSRLWREGRDEAEPWSELMWLALPEGTDAESHSSSAYVDLSRRFLDAGMNPIPLAQVYSQNAMPSLVYLGCGIEQTNETPQLTSGFLTAVTLGAMLAAARTSTRPVVILDPPRPYSLSEAVECLYWRNLFADQLMNTGTVAAVLALGLAPYEEQTQNIERLLRALNERVSLTKLIEDIRVSASDQDPVDRIVAFRAAALFTLDPNQRFGWGTAASL
jgi:hypothetical protein